MRWHFDIDIGYDEPYFTMEELTYAGEQFASNGNWDACLNNLTKASESGYMPAMFALARILMDNSAISLSQAERFKKSEKLLLKLDERSNNTADVAHTLSRFYCDKVCRPVSAYGYYLKAVRLSSIPLEKIKVRGFERLLVNHDLESIYHDVQGLRLLGAELLHIGDSRPLHILRLAADLDNTGITCLEFADYLHDLDYSNACAYYQLAAKRGYPSILQRKDAM